MPLRVNALALVEQQVAVARVVFDDLHEVIGCFVLVQQGHARRGRAQRPGQRGDRQHGQHNRHPQQAQRRAAILQRQPDKAEHEQQDGENQECARRADGGNEQQDRREGADDAAEGRERVELPGGAACLLHVREGQPDRKRRDAAEQRDRRGKQNQHADE